MLTKEQVDTLDATQMARWLRETAANTRSKRESPHLSAEEINLAPHVAFRLEQAADLLEHLDRGYAPIPGAFAAEPPAEPKPCEHLRSKLLAEKDSERPFQMRECLDCEKIFRVRSSLNRE